MLARIRTFIEDRTGLGGLLRQAFDAPIEGGARFGHVFGNALAILFVVECVTGVLLMLTYTPSVNGAWSSVFYIEEKVVGGWFVRGLHSYGAEAMLVVLGLHLLQQILYGAYKKPHEVRWWLTLGFGGLLLGFLLTGLRLPWDQHSFWALQVEMNIAAAMPVVGAASAELVGGGPTLGQATLTRLYAVHVVVLPALTALLIVAIRWLRQRNGAEVPPWGDPGKTGPALRQLVYDLSFVVVVLAVVAVLTTMTEGRFLYSPAEPSRDFPARPEWFLLPLYKLRMLLPASLELVATVVLPGLVAGFFFMLPFLDRSEKDGWVRRAVMLIPVLAIFGGLGFLTAKSMADDAADEEHVEALELAKERAERSIVLARRGIPPAGPVAMLHDDPWTRGKDVYAEYCASCHVLDGKGERKAPDHTGFGSREWIRLLLDAPQDDHFFGKAELADDMPSQSHLGDEALTAITEFMFSLGVEPQDATPADETKVAAGETIFRRKCMRCHIYEGDGDLMGVGGPNLTYWGSRTWIFRQIAHPGAETQYGGLNDMPAFDDQLSEHDLRMVTTYLRGQRFLEPDFEVETEED